MDIGVEEWQCDEEVEEEDVKRSEDRNWREVWEIKANILRMGADTACSKINSRILIRR